MLSLGSYYSVVAFLAIAIHVIINFKLMIGNGGFTSLARPYRNYLLGALSFYLSDALWGILDGLGWIGLVYADTVIYFITLTMFVVMWCRFAIPFLNLEGLTAKAIIWFSRALLALCLILLLANFFTDGFFHIDEQGRYLTGSYRLLYFAMLFTLCSLMAALVLGKALTSRGATRRRNILVLAFSLTMIAAIAVQTIWPLLPFTSFGSLIGGCFLHTFVIEEERNRLRQAVFEREQAKKHLAELEHALELARSAEKARSMFFSIVSHDIRTPLNAILGYSELLQSGIEDKAGRDEALDSIRASGNTLLQLVNDILDLAKMDSGKMAMNPAPVRLTRLVDEVFSSLRMAANAAGVEFADRTEGVPELILDENRCRQIIYNLVGNAVKFTRNGTVAVAAAYSGGILEFTVADTGCGIAPDMLSRIMEPFVQIQDPSHCADRSGGTGLGLSICRSLAKTMGGELSVESELGKGSTFRVRIPCAEAASGHPTPADVPGSTVAPGKAAAPDKLPQRVLIVDDSSVNRSVLQAFLKKAGIASFSHATDGYEALAALDQAEKEGRPYDFVLSDFWMPNLNGLEFIEKLRADPRFSQLKVFAVTADTETGNDSRSKLFNGILFKPLTFGRLMQLFSSLA